MSAVVGPRAVTNLHRLCLPSTGRGSTGSYISLAGEVGLITLRSVPCFHSWRCLTCVPCGYLDGSLDFNLLGTSGCSIGPTKSDRLLAEGSLQQPSFVA